MNTTFLVLEDSAGFSSKSMAKYEMFAVKQAKN